MTSLWPKLADGKGNIFPFEILIRASNIDASAAQLERVAVRINGRQRS
jgi:hypothetical protein